MTWDQKLARAIRRLFQRLAGRMPGFEEWGQEKAKAQQETLASQRAKGRNLDGRI